MKFKIPGYYNKIYKEKGTSNRVDRLLIPSVELDFEILDSNRSYMLLKSDLFTICITGNKKIYNNEADFIFKTNKAPTEDRIKKNEIRITSLLKSNVNKKATPLEITNSWRNNFKFVSEDLKSGVHGLRTPQIGALYSLLGHLQSSEEIGTIVLPTGTGKTETMISALVANPCQKLLVIVPSNALRDQLFTKFYELGLLRKFGLINNNCLYPNTGIAVSKFKSKKELMKFFELSNVIVTTMSLANSWSEEIKKEVAKMISHLFIDEAHHVKANTWLTFRNFFDNNKVVQFTATPFRNDRKKIDGKHIFNYPLSKAQADGYYKKIEFIPISEYDETKADGEIAKMAVSRLRDDLSKGYEHILFARCDSKKRATQIFELYKNETDLKPVMIYSSIKDKNKIQKKIESGYHKIIVAVDMLGEGFDLPQLKVAAFHDIRKSLAVTLQFAGRFTRTSFDKKLGEASFIANIADLKVKEELEELYAQDANWNLILAQLSGTAIEKEIKTNQFFEDFKGASSESISLQNIRSSLSTFVYKNNSDTWFPRNFKTGYPEFEESEFQFFNVNSSDQTLVVISGSKNEIEWGYFKDLSEFNWTLIIAYWETKNNNLFIHTTNKKLDVDKLAASILDNKEEIINKEPIFKALHNVNRLLLKSVGLKKFIGRNISYNMNVGADVQKALSPEEQKKSQKSSLFGSGFESGKPTTIGCSYKGKIWSYARGSIFEFKEWCDNLSKKLSDPSFKVEDVLKHTLSADLISSLPPESAIWVDWNSFLLSRSNLNISVQQGEFDEPLLHTKLLIDESSDGSKIIFTLLGVDIKVEYKYEINNDNETPIHSITPLSDDINIKYSTQDYEGAKFLMKFLPTFWFADGSSLNGNDYVKLTKDVVLFEKDRLISWDWTGIDISKEARKVDPIIIDSIQFKVIEEVLKEDHDIIYDDDYSGEIADVICIKKLENNIRIQLYHLKFAKSGNTGNDISNFYEVCGQAQKSVLWQHAKGEKIFSHLLKREPKTRKGKSCTRLLKGTLSDLEALKKIAKREMPIEFEIFIVQPSLIKENASDNILSLLGVTESYLTDLAQIELKVLCS